MTGVYRIYSNPRKSIFGSLNVTTWIILVNIVFFIITLISLSFVSNLFNYIALKPSDIMQGKYLWTFLTSMFMHVGFFHLFINMFILFNLGGIMEKIIGKKRFLGFYLISGLIAGVMFVFLSYFFGNTGIGIKIFGSPEMAAVGASGAIFAIAGLFMILTPKLKFMIIFLPFFSLPAYIMIPLVLFGTWLVSSSTGFPIGNTAHFGGFLCGLFYGLYLKQKYPKKIKMVREYFH